MKSKWLIKALKVEPKMARKRPIRTQIAMKDRPVGQDLRLKLAIDRSLRLGRVSLALVVTRKLREARIKSELHRRQQAQALL